MKLREMIELFVRHLVELIIRLLGVAFLYNALAAVPAAIGNFCPIFPHLNFRSLFPSLILIGWPLVAGLYLVRGAPWLMRFAFGERKLAEPSTQPGHRDLFGGGTTPP